MLTRRGDSGKSAEDQSLPTTERLTVATSGDSITEDEPGGDTNDVDLRVKEWKWGMEVGYLSEAWDL